MAKEKWIHLTYGDLAEVLANDEIERLNTISLSASIEDVCQRQLDSVASAYRAAFMGKGYNMDERANYLPNGYAMYALALARYFICTRFPNSKDLFLDEPRTKLFDKAQALLEDPSIGVPDPDYSDVPELSATDYTPDDKSFTLPYQRILPEIGKFGFDHPYARDYQLSGYGWF